MNGVYSRTVAWLLMSVAVGLLAWALDLRELNAAAGRDNLALQQQLQRAKTQQLAQPAETNREQVAEQALAWRKAAQSHGSDARNIAAMLARVKVFCDTSGLKECQIKRSSLRTTGLVQAPSDVLAGRLAPYGINVLSRFDAKAVAAFAQALTESGLLYRYERVNIVQNRAEWDIVFFVFSSEDSPAMKALALGSAVRTSGK